jgi:hypothetical protein
MVYNGVTYTNAEANSLILAGGTLSAASETDGFLLVVSGVGGDGSVVSICNDSELCNPMCTILLNFDVGGPDSFIAESGTVTRNGNTIKIDAIGLHDPADPAPSLVATIVVGSVIDY